MYETKKNYQLFVIIVMLVLLTIGVFIGMKFSKEEIRNSIICEYLMKDVIIAIQCFLMIKVGTNNRAGRIINGDMKLCFRSTKPRMNRSIHLKHLAKVSTTWTPRVSILDCDDIRLQFGLNLF